MSKDLVPASRAGTALAHPLTRYPIAIGAGAAVAALVLHGGLWLYLFAGVALAVGFASFTLRALTSAYAPRQAEIDAQSRWESQLREVRHGLGKRQFDPGFELLTERAISQFEQARSRFKAFEKILADKMNPGEMTYERYHEAAERVFLAIIENLRAAGNRLGAAASPDDEQSRKSTELLGANDQALVELDRVSAALADVTTKAGAAGADLTTLMGELEQLAERAKKYSV